MPSVTVYFVGLCTHLTKSSSGVTPHRVVLVNAGRDRLVNGRLVRRHVARLVMRDAHGVEKEWVLDGATITLNAVGSTLTYERSFTTCIPSLLSYARSELPPLSAVMTAGEKRDLVSAYFDASGTFSAGRTERGAAVAVLRVETHAPPRVTIDPFEDEKPRETIDLPDQAILRVENVDPSELRPAEHDFLMHYKVFTNVPSDADWPRDLSGCGIIEVPSSDEVTIEVGCSNSAYP